MHLEGLKGSGRGLLDELLLLWNLTVATGMLGRSRESTNLKGQNKTECALTAKCRLPPHTGRLAQDTRFINIYLRLFYSAYKCHTQSWDGGGIDTTVNNRSKILTVCMICG